MKNYYLLLCLLFPIFLLGQLEPISEFDTGFGAKGALTLTPLEDCQKFDNIIVGQLGGHFYYQDEDYVYGVFNRKRKSPKILKIRKSDGSIEVQNALRKLKQESVFSTFHDDGFTYVLTRSSTTERIIKVYKLKGFELIKESTFKNNGTFPFSLARKDLVVKDIFIEDGVVYFIDYQYDKKFIITKTIELDTKVDNSKIHSFKYELGDTLKVRKNSRANNFKNAVSIIENGKVYQLFKTRKKILLAIHSLETKELLQVHDIYEKGATFYSLRSSKDFTWAMLNKSPILKDSFFYKNKAKQLRNKGYLEIRFQKRLRDSQLLVLAQHEPIKKLQSGYGPHTGLQQVIVGYKSFYSFLEFKADGISLKKETPLLTQLDDYNRFILNEKNANEERRAVDLLLSSKTGYKLLSFDKNSKKFYIY